MIIKEKENDMNHFNTAKKYFNSSPSDYINSLKELNQISFLIQNISVMHMKVLCLLMLSKYEEIIECYYINKKYFDTLFEKVEDNEEKSEIKKIIALAFYNFNGKQKAKQICPEIKDDYEHKIEKLEITFLTKPKIIDDSSKRIESVRVNLNKTLTNIKKELDKSIKKSTQKELKKISSNFIDDLFDNVKDSTNKKNLLLNENNLNNLNEIEIIEEKKSLNSSGTNIYLKLKEEINNIDKIEKDDGNLITFEDKIKPIELIESNKENEKIEIQNKQSNDELIKSKEKQEEKKIKNSNNNEINIYSNTNNNANSSSKEKNKKTRNLEIPRKSCNPLSFVNPIEFTLCPGEVSLNSLSGGSLINGESGDENLYNKKITVEVDGEQYIFVKNEKFINIDSNNNSDNFEEYININLIGNRNRIKKKSSKLKNSKSVTINFDRKLEDLAKSEKDIKIDKQIRKANYKKTSVFKTNYILDNK